MALEISEVSVINFISEINFILAGIAQDKCPFMGAALEEWTPLCRNRPHARAHAVTTH